MRVPHDHEACRVMRGGKFSGDRSVEARRKASVQRRVPQQIMLTRKFKRLKRLEFNIERYLIGDFLRLCLCCSYTSEYINIKDEDTRQGPT